MVCFVYFTTYNCQVHLTSVEYFAICTCNVLYPGFCWVLYTQYLYSTSHPVSVEYFTPCFCGGLYTLFQMSSLPYCLSDLQAVTSVTLAPCPCRLNRPVFLPMLFYQIPLPPPTSQPLQQPQPGPGCVKMHE